MDLLDRLQAAFGSTYHLERELGGGGMSRVFVATESALGRRVVIKVLPPELAAGLSVERFRREIQLAASLQHPHIVPLLAAGPADGLLYYTMPLIEGESLRTKIAREGELPIGEAVRILRDVVDALVCAHEHDIIHRDIKPDNVLITRHHGLVTDFGVAKALSEATGTSSFTSTGLALGSPAYMAPEQATADPHLDHRVDIYAVGALAYEMLSGRPPFTGGSPQALLAAHVTQTPERVTVHRASVPPAFAALIMRCLEKRPADRFQSAEELLHLLEGMATPSAGTAPTEARTAYGAPKRLAAGARALRRHRAIYLALGALIVLGLGWSIIRYGGSHAADTPLAETKTVVVLPFENLGRPEDEYFADGITEEVTNRLTGLSGLRVISRNSAKQYKGTKKPLKQIGEELGASHVLVGTVRWEKAGDAPSRVRVTPELIRIADGTDVWAHGYDAVMAGVFQVQSDIATEVANALDVALAAPERAALASRPTADPDAYEYYLRGNDFFNRGWRKDDLLKSVQMYEEAIHLDPRFAAAFAKLAQAHDMLYWNGHDRTQMRLTKVKGAVDEALRLSPNLPLAHASLGMYFYHGKRDYPRALEQFATALKGMPNDSELLQAIGFVQRRQARWVEALSNITRGAELEPRSMLAQMEAGITHLLMRHYVDAVRYFDRAILLAPDQQEPYGLKAWALVSQGDTEGARQVLNEGVRRVGLGKMLAALTPAPLYLLTNQPTLKSDLERLGPNDFGSDTTRYFLCRAQFHEQQGQPVRARSEYDSARVLVEAQERSGPAGDYIPHQKLGVIYAKLKRTPDAIREAKLAAALLPMSRDAFFGTEVLAGLAEVYAITGNAGAAIDQLSVTLSVPSWISAGHLRADPTWAPLRRNPRFQKLVASAGR
jgi:TolB-like protein